MTLSPDELPARNPLISVVIPHFSREGLLKKALRSVEAQLYRPIEIIVIDDASPIDPSPAVAALSLTVPVRVIVQPKNLGPSSARNVGIAAAAGDYIAFLDSDDDWKPNKIATQVVAALDAKNPDRVFCIAQTVIQWPGRTETRPCWDPLRERLGEYLFLSGGIMQTSSFLVAKQLALSVGFEGDLRQFEDLLFVLAAAKEGAEFKFQSEWLFSWYRDDRDDQLSRATSLQSGFVFLDRSAALLNRKERLAFVTRFLGPALAKRRPFFFLRHSLEALWFGILTPRRLAGILYRSIAAKVV